MKTSITINQLLTFLFGVFASNTLKNWSKCMCQCLTNMELESVLKKYGKFIFKCILYIILLISFINLYLIDEILNYTKGSTTLSSRTEKVEFLEVPYMTLCFDPPFKPSMISKHGLPKHTKTFTDIYKALEGMDMEMYENFSYKYEKDFDIKLDILKFTNGSRLTEEIDFEIQKVVTFRNGLCHLIKYNVNLSVSNDKIRLHFSYKGHNSDTPESAKILLSSPRGWYGIIMDDWPLFDPAILTIPIEKQQALKWSTKVSQTDFQYMTGTEDFGQCLVEQIDRNSICKTKCYPFLFNFLPNHTLCNSNEHPCMFDMIVRRWKYRYECLHDKKTIQYKASIYPGWKSKTNGSEIFFWVYFDKSTKDIKEEVLVVTTGSLIGSVGGSLGLFLGFSFFTYFSGIIDKVWS